MIINPRGARSKIRNLILLVTPARAESTRRGVSA